jgi:hypothetical protein
MDIDGAAQSRTLKFKELVYTIETGEAEMISVDFVARGGGNATAVDGTATKKEEPKVEEDKSKAGKGKGKQKEKPKEETIDVDAVLTADDEEGEILNYTILLSWLQLLTSPSSLNTHSKDERHPHVEPPHLPPARLPRISTAFLPL